MLVDIETFFLDTLVNTDTYKLLDTEEQYCSCYCCPYIYTKDTQALSSEETEATTIEGTTIDSQKTSHQCTEDTAYTVY